MQYYRFKCGEHEMWGSMGPRPCDGCSKCGTTLTQDPAFHTTPEPHEFIPTDVETDAGKAVLHRCKWCLKTRAELGLEPEESIKLLDKMVDAFLTWPLPKSVCSDGCVTTRNYPGERSGTNLLTADEARQMFEHILTVTHK
jgi:hypothetical protein